MGDELDIDSLINELEGALAPSQSSRQPSKQPVAASAPLPTPPLPAPAATSSASLPQGSSLSVDELLRSLSDEAMPATLLPGGKSCGGGSAAAASLTAQPGGGSSSSSSSSSGGGSSDAGKCVYLCLGASEAPLGSTRSMASRKACPALRCTACDFAVQAFRGSVAWSSGAAADYLFFRNVFPDREKLGRCLQAAPGGAAYCCQCSWVSVLPSDGLTLVRRPGVGALTTSATAPDATSIAKGGRVGGQGWTHWVCAGSHAS